MCFPSSHSSQGYVPCWSVCNTHCVYTYIHCNTYLAMPLDNWFAFDPVLDTGSADQGFGCQQKLIGQLCLPVLSLTANSIITITLHQLCFLHIQFQGLAFGGFKIVHSYNYITVWNIGQGQSIHLSASHCTANLWKHVFCARPESDLYHGFGRMFFMGQHRVVLFPALDNHLRCQWPVPDCQVINLLQENRRILAGQTFNY